MNDSFLEELNLVSKTNTKSPELQPFDRHITTRQGISPPLSSLNVGNRNHEKKLKSDKIISSSSSRGSKENFRSSASREDTKQTSGDSNKISSSTPKTKQARDNLKKLNSLSSIQNTQPLDSLTAVGSTQYFDKSKSETKIYSSSELTKENVQPKESKSGYDVKPTALGSDTKLENNNKLDSVNLLSSIEDIVKTHTTRETIDLSDQMRSLHVTSQINLVKSLTYLTNDLVSEIRESRNFGNLTALAEENDRLKEDNFILQTRLNILKTKLDENAQLKEENIMLKLRIRDLQRESEKNAIIPDTV